jgi:hypothetical protein
MPFIRKGKKVYRRNPDGSLTLKGESKTVGMAKRYMRALYVHSDQEDRKRRKGR